MLEMRLLIAYFVWHFDATLVSREEPLYEDRFVIRRGPLQVLITPIQSKEVVEK